MVFGENILSRSPTDWSVVNGSMTTENITLNAGGHATQVLTLEDVLTIPEAFYVSVIASMYTDSYNPTAYIVIRAQTTDNTYYEYTTPLIDTGNGFCTVTFPVVTASYVSLSFTIRTDFTITVTDWVLSGPVADEVDFDEIRQEIPKLLDDYNTAVFTVGQEEVTIGLITAELLQNTDMNGHFFITYISPVSTLLTIRIKDNNITELYTPILYNIAPGRNSIGIPHAYLRKFVGIHTFTVTAQVSTGTISIITRGMLYTIDGGHLAKRLMDIDAHITDLTVKRLLSDNSPSQLFAVGIEDGNARVRSRPIKGGADVVWEPLYEVGPAKTAAIEFDGIFSLVNGTKTTLYTDDLPYLFWTDLSDTLWTQYGDDDTSREKLADNVISISACRAWNSIEFPEIDDGLIVAYIKTDGSVAYRTRVGKALGFAYWDPEEVIEEAGVGNTAVHVHRLNDYRVGFSVAGCNKQFISTRSLLGQGIKASYVEYKMKNRPVFSVEYTKVNTGVRALEVASTRRISESLCEVTFNYDVVVQDEYAPNLTATYYGNPVQVLRTYATNGKLYIETAPRPLSGVIKVTIGSTTSITYKVVDSNGSSALLAPPMVIPVGGQIVRISETVDFGELDVGIGFIDYNVKRILTESVNAGSVQYKIQGLSASVAYAKASRPNTTQNAGSVQYIMSTPQISNITYEKVGNSPI